MPKPIRAFEISAPARARTIPPTLLGCGVGLALLLAQGTGFAARGGPTAEGEIAPAQLPGTITTLANGDRVNALLREGPLLWSATEGGGLLRWNLDAGDHRGYLAPQDGLPSNTVQALLRDAEGRLWAATEAGLARFDPAADRWAAVPGPGPASDPVVTTALALAPDGSIWVGLAQRWSATALNGATGERGAFAGGGLARFDPRTARWGSVQRADPEDPGIGLPSDNVTALATDAQGRLWVGARPAFVWNDEAEDGGQAWLLRGGGLALFDPAAAEPWTAWVPAAAPCLADQVRAIAIDPAGRAWVATLGRGVQVFLRGPDTRPCVAGGGHVAYTRSRRGPSALPGNNAWSLSLAPDGRVWAGLADGQAAVGLAVLDFGAEPDEAASGGDDRWERIALEGPADPKTAIAAALLVAADGSVHAGTQAPEAGEGWGILQRDAAGLWQTLSSAATGLPGNRVSALAVHPDDGALWLGLDGRGVARWDGASWQAWRAADHPGLAGDEVTGLAIGADGRVWVASRASRWDGASQSWRDGGVSVFDGQAWTEHARRAGDDSAVRPDPRVEAIGIDTAGGVWAGSDGAGSFRYDPVAGTWTQHAPPGPAADGQWGGNRVTALAADPVSGAVWLGHRSGSVCDPAELPERCLPIQDGGGLSRHRAPAEWRHWSKAAGASLEAFGVEGEITAALVDPRRGLVWAGAWVDQAGGFHWGEGRGIDAALNACPLPCDSGDWQGRRFEDGGAVRALALDGAGRLWAGLHRNGIGTVPPRSGLRILGPDGEWRRLSQVEAPLPSDEVTALAALPEGMAIGTLDRGAAIWIPLQVRDRAFLPALGSGIAGSPGEGS